MTDQEFTAHLGAVYAKLYGLALRREQHQHRAEELLHQALERAWKKRDTFQGETIGELVQWIKTIMSREWAENPTFRKAQIKTVAIESWHEPAETQRAGYWSRYLDEVVRVMDSGPVAMFAFEDMTYQEIAEIMGVGLNTVATRVKRDRDRIIEALS